jgi:tetratricopeptide (TPR) repeat protein
MLSHRSAFIVSFVLVALCYVNSLPNEFVFDDGPIVGVNPAIRAISPVQFLKSPYWAKQYEGIYRPFTIFSLSVDYAIWRQWAPGFRLTNLAVHAVNGFLVFVLATSLVGAGMVPVAAMVLYLIHPVHSEAVTGIIGRSDLFATCFLLSAWLLFRRGHTLLPAGLFFLALLSKENAIMLLGILLLDFLWSRYAPPDRLGTPEVRKGDAAFRIAVMVSTAVGYLILRFSVLGGFGIPASAQYMGGQLTYIERLMTSGRVFLEYLRLLFFPLNLAGDYDFNSIPIANVSNWDAWLGLCLIAGALLSAFFLRRRYWVVSFGVLFAFLVFLPVSNWITPISVLMAERFLYLPMIGLSMAAAVIFAGIPDRRLQRLVGVGVLVLATVLCNSHDYIRRNDFTFFGNMVRVVPNSAKARLGYGYALLQAGFREDAARQFEAGLRIIPDFPELLTTLAMTKMTSKDCSEAWSLLNRALEIDPGHADTHRRMGDCYMKEGKYREAESMYRHAVQSIPYPDSMLYFMWGRTLEDTGQKESAISAYERAALIDPKNVFIQQKLNALRP